MHYLLTFQVSSYSLRALDGRAQHDLTAGQVTGGDANKWRGLEQDRRRDL